MKWRPDDSFLKKTEGKVQPIEGKGNRPLPWWFRIDCLRPVLKAYFWKRAVIFRASEQRTQTGYKIGIIVNGHAYVYKKVLYHRNAIIYVNECKWTIFAVDLFGEVIPDTGGNERGPKEFHVDTRTVNTLDEYLSGWTIVD